MRGLERVRRAHVVVAALAGAGLGLLVASRPLASAATAADVLGAGARVTATGATLAPAYPALLSAAGAAALALALAGRWLRVAVAAVLLAAGVAAEIAWRLGLAGAADTLARVSTAGVAGGPTQDVHVDTAVALGGDAAAVIVALAGVAALVTGSRWSGISRRYDAVPTDRPPSPAGRSDGPTAPASGLPARDTGASKPRPRPSDDWDSLSRGEDPTL